ncbi:hypothetical protein ACIXOG_19515 [Bacteroides fragilis]
MASKQVLSIEQMKHLQELGLDTSNATLTWILYPASIRGDVIPTLKMWRWEQIKDEQKKSLCAGIYLARHSRQATTLFKTNDI